MDAGVEREGVGPVFWLIVGSVMAGLLVLQACQERGMGVGARLEATACVQVRGTAISEFVRERSTRQALETRVGAGVAVPGGALGVECTPDGELDALETVVAGMVGVLCGTEGPVASVVPSLTAFPSGTVNLIGTVVPSQTTVKTQTAQPTWTPRPTWTVDPVLFTPTATVTPDPLCFVCSENDQGCPEPWNFFCSRCASGKWRCVRRSFPVSDCMVCLREGVDAAAGGVVVE